MGFPLDMSPFLTTPWFLELQCTTSWPLNCNGLEARLCVASPFWLFLLCQTSSLWAGHIIRRQGLSDLTTWNWERVLRLQFSVSWPPSQLGQDHMSQFWPRYPKGGGLIEASGKGSPPYWQEMQERKHLSLGLDVIMAARGAGNDCGLLQLKMADQREPKCEWAAKIVPPDFLLCEIINPDVCHHL